MDRNIRAWGWTGEARPLLRRRQLFILLNSIVKACLEYPDSCECSGGTCYDLNGMRNWLFSLNCWMVKKIFTLVVKLGYV